MKKPAKRAHAHHPVHHQPVSRAARHRRHLAALKAAATRKRNAKKGRKAPVRTLARPGNLQLNGAFARGSGETCNESWILGGNDVLDCCAAVAVANSLLASTGIRVTDADVAALFRLTGPASIEDTLRAVLHAGIGGHRPRSITDLSLTPADLSLTGLVLGVTLTEPHAVTVAPGGRLITWGLTVPGLWPADEAWKVAW